MFDQAQRFQIARRFEFSGQGEALRFVHHLAEMQENLGGDHELDLAGNTLTVRIAAAPCTFAGLMVAGFVCCRPGKAGPPQRP